jgi:hypothetical protein
MNAEINPKYPGALHLADTNGPDFYKYDGALHQKQIIRLLNY